MNDLRERFSILCAVQKIFHQNPRVAKAILESAGSVGNLFQGDRGRFREHFGDHRALWQKFFHFDDWMGMGCDADKILSLGMSLICLLDEDYPPMLREVYDPPPVLAVKGKGKDLLRAPCVGIVGARKAGMHGREMAAEIAERLSARGICVVSGMAIGIDSAAHRGALSGDGSTIAVFGCGPDIIYPASNRELASAIINSGLIVSEFPIGTRPEKSFFPQRNRIISGLSVAVLVIEAAKKSGSLITARHALDQGRDVLAVPGAGGTVAVRGSNMLIRDGALLVEDGDEVAEFVEKGLSKWPFLKKPGHFEVDVDKGSPLLGAFPARGAVTVDFLVSESGIEAARVLEDLTKLVLGGVIEELPGRRFCLKGV